MEAKQCEGVTYLNEWTHGNGYLCKGIRGVWNALAW